MAFRLVSMLYSLADNVFKPDRRAAEEAEHEIRMELMSLGLLSKEAREALEALDKALAKRGDDAKLEALLALAEALEGPLGDMAGLGLGGCLRGLVGSTWALRRASFERGVFYLARLVASLEGLLTGVHEADEVRRLVASLFRHASNMEFPLALGALADLVRLMDEAVERLVLARRGRPRRAS